VSDSTPRYKVLVVDDSRFTRRIIQLVLEKSGAFDVVGCAVDGVEGLEKIREFNPDVVTVDFDMPRMNGMEMIRRLRAESSIPAVLVSALPAVTSELENELSRIGVTETVLKTLSDKPADLILFAEDLVTKLRRVCEARGPR
jgi:two-component system, chemotaxis family, protein-glutamate methylesterase/glutaminase